MEKTGKTDKAVVDLIDIMHFIEKVSVSIYTARDENELYKIIREQCIKSRYYSTSILWLSDDRSKLRIAQTTFTGRKLKQIEKTTGLRLKGYMIDLKKSNIYRRVIKEGKTVHVRVSDVINELFPKPLTYLITKITDYHKKKSILTPLRRHDKVIGVFGISSPKLSEYFIPSVENFASHISNALKLVESDRQLKNFQLIVESAHDAIFFKDLESRYWVANDKALEAFGLSKQDVIGKTDYELMLDPEEAKKNVLDDQIVFASGMPREIVKRMTSKDGKEYWFQAVKVPQFDNKGTINGLVGIARDITQQKRLEKEIVEIEAREQLRIGHDLHDGLGQHLTGLELSCRALEERLMERGRVSPKDIAKVADLVSQASDHVRHLSKGLSPVEKKPDGLMSALHELARNTEETFGISCKFDCTKQVLIPDPFVSMHLYRVTQEVVTNSIRHAQAQKIKIKLTQNDSQLKLMVEDDGKGISKPLRADRGMGLKIMQYRANLIGATLDVENGKNRGTVVRCTIS